MAGEVTLRSEVESLARAVAGLAGEVASLRRHLASGVGGSAEAVGSPYLTLAEAAAYSRRTPQTLKAAKCRGKLKAVRSGRPTLFTRDELDRWLHGE